MQDPFYVVKGEVQSSLTGLTTLYDQWQDMLSKGTTSGKEYDWTANALKNGIRSIEWDLQDLDETVSIVSKNRAKFNIDDAEFASRQRFITDTRKSVARIKSSLQQQKGAKNVQTRASLMGTGGGGGGGGGGGSSGSKTKNVNGDRYSRLEEALEEDNEAFVRNQQQSTQMMMREQDQDLAELGTAVGTLGEISTAMYDELGKQRELLDDIDEDVDNAGAKLKHAIMRVDKLIDGTKEKTQWCIIIGLMAVLLVLCIAIFYV